jgi:hypothetical protein
MGGAARSAQVSSEGAFSLKLAFLLIKMIPDTSREKKPRARPAQAGGLADFKLGSESADGRRDRFGLGAAI